MSSRNKAAIVSRAYNATPDACTQAVKLLLNTLSKENAAGVTSTNGDDAKGSLKHDRATRNYT